MVLMRDARNFAAWYQHVVLDRQDLVPDLTLSLREVIDGFRGIRLPLVGLYELRLDELSDGQRALIALYSLLRLGVDQGFTFFLDEPENYVALAEIQPWLTQLADACGGSVRQAVLSSHHPELVDYLGLDRGIVLRREDSGQTVTKAAKELTLDGGPKLSEIIARGWES
jgi:hypothetical protein